SAACASAVIRPAGLRRVLGYAHCGPSKAWPDPGSGVRDPPPPWPGEGGQPARRVPGHRPGPPLLRPGPRPAGRTHRRTRTGNRLGPARVPPFRPDPPRRAGRLAADADGEVPAQEAGECPPLLQAVTRGDLGADQPARAWRRAPLNLAALSERVLIPSSFIRGKASLIFGVGLNPGI